VTPRSAGGSAVGPAAGGSAVGPAAVEELAARRDLYRLASRLLAREIDAPLYDRLLAVGMLDGDASVDELAAEFCRLFVGPRPVCLPYASARGSTATLRAGPERRFVEFLAAHGLETVVDADLTLLGQDHLAVELAVLAHLYDRAAAAPGSAAAELAQVQVTEHLLPWAAEFAEELAAEARLAPYTTVAHPLAALLREEPALAPTSAFHDHRL